MNLSDIPLLADLDQYCIDNLTKHYDTIEKHKLNKQVVHYVIDFVSSKANEQLKLVQNKTLKGESGKLSDLEMCFFFFLLNNKYEHDIVNQHFIRSYIDYTFESTKKYYYFQCLNFITVMSLFLHSILRRNDAETEEER